MKPEIKRRWVKALRSKHYQQGYGRLHKVDHLNNQHSFCALGVLGELYCEEMGKEWPDLWKTANIYSLGEDLQQWSGLDSEGHFGVGFKRTSTIWINDKNRWSFNQIANYIEAYA